MAEPLWLNEKIVLAIHDAQIAEHGGFTGVRDEHLLHSALDRPKNKFFYHDVHLINELAASYVYGLAKNHPFNDGNKRTAFVVMVVFLEMNNFVLNVSEQEAFYVMEALVTDQITETQLADWLNNNFTNE